MDGNQSCCEGGKIRRCRNRLRAAPNWPPRAILELCGVLIHEKRYFSYFRRTGTAWHWVCTTRRQAPYFGLGTTIFLIRAVFVKLHFSVR